MLLVCSVFTLNYLELKTKSIVLEIEVSRKSGVRTNASYLLL